MKANKAYKRILASIVSLITILSFCVSCFGILFVPLVPSVAGLPSYTLDEEYVEQTLLCLESAKKNTLENNVNQANVEWVNFNYSFYEIASQTNVAYILYASDTSNKTYRDNYLFANSAYNDVYASYMKALKDIYNSDVGDTFLEGFSDEDLNRIVRYSDKIATLENEISALQIEYASIPEEDFHDESVVIYKQIVAKNNEIAREYGFANYYDYASSYVYARDYTSAQLIDFRQSVSQKLPTVITSLKNQLEGAKEKLLTNERNLLNSISSDPYTETEVNYWDAYLQSYDDVVVRNDLNHAFDNHNVLLANGNNSREMAFTAYLPAYNKSFCYFGPKYQDVFTIAHEIGHYFAGRYTKQGSTSLDLRETHSQGNEMLLLQYLSNELNVNSFKALELNEMSSILITVVVCTIIDEFEYYVYTHDVSAFSPQDFDNIMNTICINYGGNGFIKTIISDINNYWRLVVAEQPLYYLSYATSGVVAINLYFDAVVDANKARESYVKLIKEHDFDSGMADNLTRAGLLSPFTSDAFTRIENLAIVTEQKQ